jgi:hypothetical protein
MTAADYRRGRAKILKAWRPETCAQMTQISITLRICIIAAHHLSALGSDLVPVQAFAADCIIIALRLSMTPSTGRAFSS